MKNELIFGNEPYLLHAYRAEAVKGIVMPEFNLMETEQFTQTERDFAKQMPFMGNRRVLICLWKNWRQMSFWKNT